MLVATLSSIASAQIQIDVSTKYSAIYHARAITLAPGELDHVILLDTPFHDRYTVQIKTHGGPLRLLLLDRINMDKPSAETPVLADRMVDGAQRIELPPVTSPAGVSLVVKNSYNLRPVQLSIRVFRSGERPAAIAKEVQRWLQIPVDAVQKFYRVPEFRISVKPCGMVNAYSTGDVVVCTELFADLQEHNLISALHPILLHEMAHSLLLSWGLPGYNNEDIADEFAVALTALAFPEAVEALVKWLEKQDSVSEAVVQLVNGDRHTISVQRARNMRAALRNPKELLRRWGKMLAPYAIVPDPQK